MKDDYPRLLVLSEEIPQTVHAGSILLHRLLRDWPPDRLLVMGPETAEGAGRLGCRYETIAPAGNRLHRTRFAGWVRSLEAFGILPGISPRRVSGLLRGFKPDVVLSVMQTFGYYGAAWRFARSRGLPLVLIVHDLPDVFEGVPVWVAGAQLRRNRSVYRFASARLCVSAEMRDFLSEKYGASGDVLHPGPADGIEPRPAAEARRLRDGTRLIVGYAGSLAYGYGHQLEVMVPAFKAAQARLRVYSRARMDCDGDGIIEYAGFAPPEETWCRIQAECDAVILAYPWPYYGHDALYRTHFPSKLPEYLQLGLPVIIVGPPSATGVKWGLRNPGSAMILTENDSVQWSEGLGRLRESPDLRATLAENAVSAARRDFDPEAIRQAFVWHVREAAGQ